MLFSTCGETCFLVSGGGVEVLSSSFSPPPPNAAGMTSFPTLLRGDLSLSVSLCTTGGVTFGGVTFGGVTFGGGTFGGGIFFLGAVGPLLCCCCHGCQRGGGFLSTFLSGFLYGVEMSTWSSPISNPIGSSSTSSSSSLEVIGNFSVGSSSFGSGTGFGPDDFLF